MGEAMSRRSSTWLGRFELPVWVRAQGAFHVAATRESASGERRVVVVPAPGRDADRTHRALLEFERVHRRLDHPRIAPVADSGDHEGVRFVALGCDAEMDLGALMRLMQQAGVRAPHAQADGFIRGLREALQAAHRVEDQGSPLCLGSLGYANVLFNRAGRHWLVGFGHNVMIHDELGRPSGGEPVFHAPEVAMGDRPSPSGDFIALILMMRSMIPAASLAPAVARAVLGRSLPEDLELVRSMLWFERRMMAARPHQRVTIEQAVEVSDRIRALLGVVPDPDGFERLVGGVMGEPVPRSALRIGPDAAWMQAPDGGRHQLGTRAALRRILLALAEARLHRPGASLQVADLIEAGWPGERPRADTGANRAYVLLSELRRLGLRDVLQRHDEGYRLDPSVPVQIDRREG